jgi:DNA replication protein DnaC
MLEDIHTLLDALKLRHARRAVAEAIKAAQKDKPSYSAFLLELLRREHEGQRDRAIASRLKRSGLDEFWTLETFPFHIQKCVNKRAIYELAELDFIARGESVVFIGQAAVGKSGLASGILMKALYAGRRCQAIKADKLFEDLRASHADRATRSRIQTLSRLDVLLIEELGYVNALDPREINDFFRLMDNRCNRKSTIITTNLGFEEWGKFLGNGPLVAALLSRLLQKCRTFVFPKEALNLRAPKLGLPARADKPAILGAV